MPVATRDETGMSDSTKLELGFDGCASNGGAAVDGAGAGVDVDVDDADSAAGTCPRGSTAGSTGIGAPPKVLILPTEEAHSTVGDGSGGT